MKKKLLLFLAIVGMASAIQFAQACFLFESSCGEKTYTCEMDMDMDELLEYIMELDEAMCG